MILEALISFLPTPADGAIGALDWTKEERQRLAKLSQTFSCSHCGKCLDLLPQLKESNGGDNNAAGKSKSRFAKEIEELQRLQQLAEKKIKPADTVTTPASAEPATEQGEQHHPTAENEEKDDDAKAHNLEPSSSLPVAMQNTTTTPITTSNQSEIVQNDPSTKEPNHESEAVPTGNHTNPTQPTTTTNTAAANTNVVEENPIPDAVEPPLYDHSWIYDPILNIMIIVLAAICYLLLQKYQDLMGELTELRRLSDMGKK